MIHDPRHVLAPFVALVMGIGSAARAAEVSFTRDVAPVLVQRCLTCHSREKAKGGYSIETVKALLSPGESKLPSIVAGKPEESRLHVLVVSPEEEERMPQRGEALTTEQVRVIEQWIRQGAKTQGVDPEAALSSIARTSHPSAPAVYRMPVPVRALALRPDGEEIAVGGYHEITVWDPADGRLLHRIGNVAQQTHGLAYSPDGSLLAAAGGTPGFVGEVKLFDVAGRAEVATLDRSAEVMLDVTFSADGSRLAAAGADALVRVYDVAMRRRMLLANHHADWVTAVAFTPDGKRIVTASRDMSVRVTDAGNGDVLATYAEHGEAAPAAVAVGTDGKTIYSGGRGKSVHVWQTAEAKKQRTIEGFDGAVLELLATSEFLFAAGADKKVRQYRMAKHGEVRVLPHEDWVYSLSIDAKGTMLATGSFNGEVRLYALPGAVLVHSFIAAPGYAPPAAPK
jgi:DNA-binding beta-propeller fold protein YncE